MSAIAVRIDGINSPSPYDLIHIDFTVVAEAVPSGWSGDLYVGWSDTADSINAALRDAAVTIAANHSVTVGSGDVVRVYGGAMETVS